MLVGSSALLALAIYGVTFLLNQHVDIEQNLENLAAISALKSTQIEDWLAEREGDVESLSSSSGFAERVLEFTDTGSVRAQQLIENRLQSLQRAYGYEDIRIMDRDGRSWISLGAGHELPGETRELMPSALVSGETLRTDVVRDSTGRLHIDVLVPLRLQEGKNFHAAFLVLLHINPDKYLFPTLQTWPTASPSGETLLVRRDGDSVVYLNKLRHVDNTPLDMKLPLGAVEKLPAAAAVSTSRAGTLAGTDYRGVPVLAAFRPVKGTEWFVVAKMDRHEVLAGTRVASASTGILSFVGLMLVGALIVKLVRTQRHADRNRFDAENARLFQLFYDLPFIGMAISSAQTQQIIECNDRLCEMLGYTRDEFRSVTWRDLSHPDDLPAEIENFDRILRGESDGYAMEKRFVCKDGRMIETAVDIRCIRKPDGTPESFFGTIQDITERKAAERAIRRLGNTYAALSHSNAVIVRARSEAELLEGICKGAIDSGAIRMCWYGAVDDTGRVRPIAWAGDGADYLADIDIRLDPDDPHGRGPTATSIREDRAFWCQDFQNDPATAPWHERGARFGWGSSASIPVHRGGRVAGAFTVYAPEPGAFDAQVRDLMLEIARNLGFALDNLDSEAARSAAESALRASEERYRLLVESSPDAILLVSPQRTVLAANPAAGAIFGCRPEELIGLPRAELLDTSDPRSALVPEALRRTGTFRGELTNIRRNGEKFPSDTSIVMLRGGKDEDRLSLVLRDITERKKAEERILAQLDELRRWHEVMLGREERVLELKAEINEVLVGAGLPARYPSAEIASIGKPLPKGTNPP